MRNKYLGGCHCGAIMFEFYSKKIVELIKCNCSICSLNSYLHLIIPHKEFKLLKGKNKIKTYQFNKKLAEHYFCLDCGIKSFYQPRSHKNSYSINYNSIKKPAPNVGKIIDFNGKNFEASLHLIK